MATSLSTKVGKDGTAELGDFIGQEGIILSLDLAATARKLGLNEKEAELLIDAIENEEYSPPVLRVFQQLRNRFANPKEIQASFVYVPTTCDRSTLNSSNAKRRMYADPQYPNFRLAKIMAAHPQANIICNGTASDILLQEQLKILSNLICSYKNIDKVLGKKHPNIGKRICGWIFEGFRPRLDDLIAVENFWEQNTGNMSLLLEYPLPAMAAVIKHHPQINEICKDEDPSAISLRKQIQIALMYFGSQLTIQKAFSDKPNIGTRVETWGSQGIRPRLDELNMIINFWDKIAMQGKIILSFEHSLSMLAKIIEKHPNAQTICYGKKPNEILLRGQLQILSDHFAGSHHIHIALGEELPGIAGRMRSWLAQNVRPRMQDLIMVANVWDQIAKGNIKIAKGNIKIGKRERISIGGKKVSRIQKLERVKGIEPS